MKKWIFLCLFLFSSAFANTFTLKEQLAYAEPGSFLVTEQNKTYTFLYVNSKAADSLVIEEVCIPASLFSQKKMSWRTWFEKGAPGHTSWLMSQINLQTGHFEEMFSFKHQGWVDISESNSFLTKLLNLPFQQVSEKERRKIGPSPCSATEDRRPLWHPRIMFEGRPVPNVTSKAWKARWPSDGTELSHKWIEIYLPDTTATASAISLPIYFPYWIEVEGKIGSAKVRVVDSGKGATSPRGQMPLRAPKVVGENFTKEGLELYLNAPAYFKEFDVIAEEVDGFGKFFPLSCKTTRLDNRTCIFIPMHELLQDMKSGRAYRFLISERENPTICIETVKPFIFTGI